MRLPFDRRPSARRRHRSDLFAMTALAPCLATAIQFTPVPEANLDISQLGRIGVAGDFSGISLYQFEEQNEKPYSTNGSESLLAQLPNGAFASVITTDASIHDMCTFTLKNGETQGVVIGGNFTSLDGIQSQGIAMFNPNTTEVTPLSGLSGQVNALLCDQETNTVYVGGNFRAANSTNAIAWVGTDGWTNLPFAGFNGPVSSITKASNGHVVFGGSFTGLGNTSTPSTPDGQVINISNANITSASSSTTTGFSDPRNIICKTSGIDGAGNTWLLSDNSAGFWQATFGFGFQPTKLRLWNTRQDGRGTKTFRFTAFPLGGILNMTYLDPATGRNASCTSECPLSHDEKVTFQDFHFVNVVGMNSFRIDISAFYGSGGGFNGIQLFEDDINSYAVNDFNAPSCADSDTKSSSSATGPWTVSPSQQSSSQYLTAKLSGTISEKSASVTFLPDLKESGNYSVNLYTPGCIQDGTCSTRGQVNITGVMSSSGNAKFTTSLYQTNNFDKYDQIYFGYIEASSADGFRPSVTLTPLAGQSIDELTVVAQRVGFTLINSTGGLNGLFDFDPKAVTVSTDFKSSKINQLGSSFASGSAVTSLSTTGDLVIVGGNFTSKDARNVIGINTANEQTMALDGGLNGEVVSMKLNGTQLFVGGEFSNTLDNAVSGLNNVGIYDTSANTWTALGAGVNGKVYHVVPMLVNVTNEAEPEPVVTFTGDFSEINAFGDNKAIAVSGFAVWVPSQKNWLQNLSGPVPAFSGILTTGILNLPSGGSIYAGSMTSATISANGAVSFSEKFGQFPVKIQSPSSSSGTLSRRDSVSSGNITGVVTGTFYNEKGRNVTILGGHFTAEGANGSMVNNLVLIDGSNSNTITGLGSQIQDNSTFIALAVTGDLLFAGGDVRGRVNDVDVRGIISVNLQTSSFNSTQPPGISGGNATITDIKIRPDSGDVYVAGSFDSAGALGCPGVCYYDLSLAGWNRPGVNLEGTGHTLIWTSKSQLVAGGNFTLNGTSPTMLAMYSPDRQAWSAYPGEDALPGPVEVLTAGSRDRNQLWVSGTASNGSIYLMKYDGSVWRSAGITLLPGTVLNSLQVFSLTESHGNTDILDSNQILMLTGSIHIPGFGTASAATFNGTTFQPFALTIHDGNTAGSIAGIFTENEDFFTDNSGHLALGFVVLIGLGISLALIFIMVIAGMALDRLRKKREGYTPAPTSMFDRGGGIQKIPPHELFESLGKGRPGAPHV
ncbi:cellular morphogenesis protein [Colletotrichum truncatum]|uniref:Cellular morphogenesis protein n=1 Tax=Colletotrichum truncatum TaxID=5467 RepID=A0ACC3Z3R7_COLTU|nr:cellular morphogenesis protein [Colletotrichum truncatum]KAF6795587.1 cellular morphogenesis protein [Colletotrichum truncatum]